MLLADGSDRRMIFARITAVCLLIAAVCGCETKRYQRESIDALKRELRWQEDQIYQLQDAIVQYQMALEHCHTKGGAGSRSSDDGDRRDPDRDGNGGRVDADLGEPSLPEVELGPPDDSGGGLPPLDSAVPKAADDDMSSSDVVDVRLHALLTGGLDRDGVPGDEGIQVVLEPLDANGQVLPAPAEVAVALMDHTLPPGEQRLAYWAFPADEAGEHRRSGGISRGLQFDLLWGKERYPANRELDVYARYTTSDGRALTAQHKVRVRLPEDVAHWKKSDRGVRSASAESPLTRQ